MWARRHSATTKSNERGGSIAWQESSEKSPRRRCRVRWSQDDEDVEHRREGAAVFSIIDDLGRFAGSAGTVKLQNPVGHLRDGKGEDGNSNSKGVGPLSDENSRPSGRDGGGGWAIIKGNRRETTTGTSNDGLNVDRLLSTHTQARRGEGRDTTDSSQEGRSKQCAWACGQRATGKSSHLLLRQAHTTTGKRRRSVGS